MSAELQKLAEEFSDLKNRIREEKLRLVLLSMRNQPTRLTSKRILDQLEEEIIIAKTQNNLRSLDNALEKLCEVLKIHLD